MDWGRKSPFDNILTTMNSAGEPDESIRREASLGELNGVAADNIDVASVLQPFLPMPKRTVSASILHSLRGTTNDVDSLVDVFSQQHLHSNGPSFDNIFNGLTTTKSAGASTLQNWLGASSNTTPEIPFSLDDLSTPPLGFYDNNSINSSLNNLLDDDRSTYYNNNSTGGNGLYMRSYSAPALTPLEDPQFLSPSTFMSTPKARVPVPELVYSPNNDHDNSSNSTLAFTVSTACRDILKEALNNTLKAVELANTLRARVGTEILSSIKETWGGLLSLLEKQPKTFRVDRIPKNDMVTLVSYEVSRDDINQLLLYHVAATATTSQFAAHGQTGPRTGTSAYGNTKPTSQEMRKNHSYNNIASSNVVNGASRCLHVGNIPAQLTEAQLLREFDKYGPVDGLKVVSNRNRRFAFVSFRTVDEAMKAKNLMSRIYPWKNAINFAHSNYHQGNNHHNSSNSENSKQNIHNHDNNLYPVGLELDTPPHTSQASPNITSSISHVTEIPRVALPEAMHTIRSQNDYISSDRVDPILRRLCDDTYVPTQQWPIDRTNDIPYCNAVMAQIVQFGGSTTISKLRGFLKSRLSSTENIKSVPLKSFLYAYPELFHVNGNVVSCIEGVSQ